MGIITVADHEKGPDNVNIGVNHIERVESGGTMVREHQCSPSQIIPVVLSQLSIKLVIAGGVGLKEGNKRVPIQVGDGEDEGVVGEGSEGDSWGMTIAQAHHVGVIELLQLLVVGSDGHVGSSLVPVQEYQQIPHWCLHIPLVHSLRPLQVEPVELPGLRIYYGPQIISIHLLPTNPHDHQQYYYPSNTLH